MVCIAKVLCNDILSIDILLKPMLSMLTRNGTRASNKNMDMTETRLKPPSLHNFYARVKFVWNFVLTIALTRSCLVQNFQRINMEKKLHFVVDLCWLVCDLITLCDMVLLAFMMTSSNGNIFRLTWLLDLCEGNSPVPGEFPTQRPVMRSFDVFFDLRLNKRLSKQSWGWWFETPSRPLWCHCDD